MPEIEEEAVLTFVRDAIRSAWSLELLVLLYREPRRTWSVDALVRELRGSTQLVEEGAAILRDAGLVAAGSTGEYSYEPKSPELAGLVAALAELYRQKPFAVLRAIFTSPSDKIQSFSDAFRFKKGEDR